MSWKSLLFDFAQTLLLIAGLFLAFSAWALDHVNEGIWPATLLASDYSRVMTGYGGMKATGAELNPDDSAFGDIVSILSEKFPSLPSPISQRHGIKVEEYKPWMARSDGYSGSGFDLLVTLEDNRSVKLESVTDLEPIIRQMYLNQPIFDRTTLFFGLGLVLALASGLLGIWKPSRRRGLPSDWDSRDAYNDSSRSRLR